MDLPDLFRSRGALLEGHFNLTSGLHSAVYVQCALVLQYPDLARRLGGLLAERVGEGTVDVVISPAVGGIVIGQETAAALGVRHIFAERAEGRMTLRRGFSLLAGERVLAVEDVVTTGGSVKEVAELALQAGASVAATASLIHRFVQAPRPPVAHIPHHALLPVEAQTWEPSVCPLCSQGIPLKKPGSRGLQNS